MRKRYAGEFLNSSFANSGRIAGIGMTCDRYDEESGPELREEGEGVVYVVMPGRTPEEREALNGPVVVSRIDEIEPRYKSDEGGKSMTKDEILAKWDALTPRARDAWVAEKIFDYKVVTPCNYPLLTFIHRKKYIDPNSHHSGCSWGERIGQLPHYSTDISAAWEVVEELRQHGVYLRFVDRHAFVQAKFCKLTGAVDAREWVDAREASEAICKAALLAKGGEKPHV